MQVVRGDTIGGINTFLDDQRKELGPEDVTTITMAQFDNEYEVLYNGAQLGDVAALGIDDFVPRGSTALLDSLAKLITDTETCIARMEVKPDMVTFVVVTDGQENASREFNREKIRKLTADKEQGSWEFVYLGANQDAFAEASKMFKPGTMVGQTMTWIPNSGGTAAAYANVSKGVTMRRRSAKSYAASNAGSYAGYKTSDAGAFFDDSTDAEAKAFDVDIPEFELKKTKNIKGKEKSTTTT